MVIFHSYVSLPEGIRHFHANLNMTLKPHKALEFEMTVNHAFVAINNYKMN